MSAFTARFLTLMLFQIPLYMLADTKTLEDLRKSFMSGRYSVDDIDNVKCQIHDNRVKDGAQKNTAQVIKGVNATGNLVIGNQQQNWISMSKWVRCVELYWWAVLFIGNACHTVFNDKNEQIPWMSLTTFLEIWCAIKQYVIEASPDIMIPYRTARIAELEFRREVFGHLAKYKQSFDETMEKFGRNELRRLFQYQTNNGHAVIKDQKRPAPYTPKGKGLSLSFLLFIMSFT